MNYAKINGVDLPIYRVARCHSVREVPKTEQKEEPLEVWARRAVAAMEAEGRVVFPLRNRLKSAECACGKLYCPTAKRTKCSDCENEHRVEERAKLFALLPRCGGCGRRLMKVVPNCPKCGLECPEVKPEPEPAE